jgi:short subunit fatty acids transporter
MEYEHASQYTLSDATAFVALAQWAHGLGSDQSLYIATEAQWNTRMHRITALSVNETADR